MQQFLLISSTLMALCVVSAKDCTQWTDYTECSAPCEGGIESKVRSCIENEAMTSEKQDRPCNQQPCPKVCGEWSDWSSCTRTCGVGSYKQRVRQCFHRNCDSNVDVEMDVAECDFVKCEIDCTGPDCKWATNTIGYQIDPLSCSAYYICHKLPNGNHKSEWFMCPGGTVWNADALTCAYNTVDGADCETIVTPPGLRTTTTTTSSPVADEFSCIFLADPNNPHLYTMSQGNRVHVYTCGPRRAFSQEACNCVHVGTNPWDCECLTFGFEGTANGDGCHSAQASVHGKLRYATGKVGQAAFFNGRSRVSVDMFRQWLAGSEDGHVSVNLWVKRKCNVREYEHQGLVVNTDCTTSSTVDLHLLNGTIQGGVVMRSSSEVTLTSNYEVPCDEWTHIAMVYDGDNLKLYVNCQLVETQPHKGKIKSSQIGLFIGHSGKQDEQFYLGWMDQLEVCRRALSVTEVEQKCLK